MVVQPRKQHTSSASLLVGFIIFLGIALGYVLYVTELIQLPVAEIEPAPVNADDSLTRFRTVTKSQATLDRILESDTYRTLEIFGESPVNPGTPGRTNIFAPF